MNPYDNQYRSGPYYRPLPPDPYELRERRRPLRRYANIIGGGLLMIEVVMVLVYGLLDFAFSWLDFSALPVEVIDLIDECIGITYWCLSFWIPTAFIVMMIGIPFRAAFPLKRPKMSIAIPAVFVCLGAAMVGSIIGGFISSGLGMFGVAPYMPDMPLPRGVAAGIVYFISTAVAPAIFEEFMFRGAILQSLRRFGDGFALVTSAVLFGLVHGNLVQAPSAMVSGLVLGYFALRTGSLIPGMMFHFVNNGLVVLYEYLDLYLNDYQYELLNVSVFVGYLLLGVAGLVYLVVRHGGLFKVRSSDYPLTEGKKHLAFYTSAAMVVFVVYEVVEMILYLEPVSLWW